MSKLSRKAKERKRTPKLSSQTEKEPESLVSRRAFLGGCFAAVTAAFTGGIVSDALASKKEEPSLSPGDFSDESMHQRLKNKEANHESILIILQCKIYQFYEKQYDFLTSQEEATQEDINELFQTTKKEIEAELDMRNFTIKADGVPIANDMSPYFSSMLSSALKHEGYFFDLSLNHFNLDKEKFIFNTHLNRIVSQEDIDMRSVFDFEGHNISFTGSPEKAFVVPTLRVDHDEFSIYDFYQYVEERGLNFENNVYSQLLGKKVSKSAIVFTHNFEEGSALQTGATQINEASHVLFERLFSMPLEEQAQRSFEYLGARYSALQLNELFSDVGSLKYLMQQDSSKELLVERIVRRIMKRHASAFDGYDLSCQVTSRALGEACPHLSNKRFEIETLTETLMGEDEKTLQSLVENIERHCFSCIKIVFS